MIIEVAMNKYLWQCVICLSLVLLGWWNDVAMGIVASIWVAWTFSQLWSMKLFKIQIANIFIASIVGVLL